MPQTVAFTAPRAVRLVDVEPQPLAPGTVRVRTWYSGVSAGTELTAYRGTNPYLTGTWDPQERMFTPGTPTFAYPVEGWGYSEVGEVVEVAPDVEGWSVGQVVYGIWGHRSDAVVPVARLQGTLAPDEALTGCFARVGAVALNAVLAASVSLGDRVAVFGQGVIGLHRDPAGRAQRRRGRRGRRPRRPPRARASSSVPRTPSTPASRVAPARSSAAGPAAGWTARSS